MDPPVEDGRTAQPSAGGQGADADAGQTRVRGSVAAESLRGSDASPGFGGGRQLELQVEGSQGERVRIRLEDSYAGVRLRMSSNETRVAEALRAGWPELERALHAAGWRAERVAEAAPRSAGAVSGLEWPGAASDGASRSGAEADGQPHEALRGSAEGGGSPGGRGRRQEQLRDEWLDLSALRRLSARRQ